MQTDLTFFTNEPGYTLLDRFKKILKHIQFFDVLVGYFRTSGFFNLYESLEDVEKIRILVGLNVDQKTYVIIEDSKYQQKLDFESHKRTKDIFSKNLTTEMDNSADDYETEVGVKKFIEFLQSGKLEIKAYPSANIHAKVYISRFPEDSLDYGRGITGSSNFSESGFVENREFNVELKNSSDVRYALEKFEDLWKDAVDISRDYVETINTRTWLNDQITPYHLYLKFLYEYFQEDINLLDEYFDTYLPEGFMELEYQKQSVVSAKKILDAYNGVFLADVVGLGKTFISALLAQQCRGKILVLCPPALKDYWYDTFSDFGIRSYRVESIGKLDIIIKRGIDRYEYIFIDEAHRFRNEATHGYEKLHQICFGKKVILVSATPLNNTIDDIYSQLKLFQIPKKCTIPGVPNLEKLFRRLKKKLEQYKKTDPDYIDAVKAVSREMREKILNHVMVRRTRTEVLKYFKDDIDKQGLHFPEVDDPQRVVYTFDEKTNNVFSTTIELLKKFEYARYTPLLYLKKPVSEFERQSQRNVGGFMKGILVKRLESSFYAFTNTLRRFIESYEKFIDMYKRGTVYISKEINVYEFLDSDNEDLLMEMVDRERVHKYDFSDFTYDYVEKLEHDLRLLTEIRSLWIDITSDPKLGQFIKELENNRVLKNRKIIIFTESKETGDHLYNNLNGYYPGKVMFYSGQGGRYEGAQQSSHLARDLIRENFDPNEKNQSDNINILITTDILAEGVNMHRSNVVINYDLPWNPTRILQRAGRINRIGTSHKKIHIFNFFPTAQSDEHLGLESNITAKLQAFHDTLGEDAKYLTDEEVVTTHELFGDRLYKRLNDKKIIEGEDGDERSELEYLQKIRKVRDEDPSLFEKIKRLPKKARSCRKDQRESNDRLLTFFRKGKLKKFCIADSSDFGEISFFKAADLFECDAEESRHPIPKEFYSMLKLNKAGFDQLTSDEAIEKSVRGSRSNESYIIKRLKSKEVRYFKGFTEEDEDFLKSVLKAFEDGIIPKNTSKRLKKEIEREINPLKVLGMIRNNIPLNILDAGISSEVSESHSREVILSEYLKSSN